MRPTLFPFAAALAPAAFAAVLLLAPPAANAQQVYFPDHLRFADGSVGHIGNTVFNGWWQEHYPAEPDPTGPNGIDTTRTHFRLSAKGSVQRIGGVGGRTYLTATYTRDFSLTGPADLQLAFYADGIWGISNPDPYMDFGVYIQVDVTDTRYDSLLGRGELRIRRNPLLPGGDSGGEVYERKLVRVPVSYGGSTFRATVRFTLDADVRHLAGPPGDPHLHNTTLTYDFHTRRPWLDDFPAPPDAPGSRGYPGGIGVTMEATPAVIPGQMTARERVRAALARETFMGGIVPTPGIEVPVGVLEPGRPHIELFDAPSPFHDSPYPYAMVGKVRPSSGTLADPDLRSTRQRSEHASAVASIIASGLDTRFGPESIGINPNAVIVARPVDAVNFSSCLADLADEVEIINMSFEFRNPSLGRAATDAVNAAVIANPNLLVVAVAGNTGREVTHPVANNGLAVGALDRSLSRRADFSAFRPNGYSGFKPDLVAPGDYVMAVQPYFDSYGYAFVGENIVNTTQTELGPVRGTSFAAPIVSGVASLLHENAIHNSFDRDSRVIKAVLMNTASRDLRDPQRPRWLGVEPEAWVQPSFVRPELAPGVPKVTFRLPGSKEYGAGVVDAYAALDNFLAGEIHEPDDPDVDHNLFINAYAREQWWDFQGLAPGRSVEYFLGPLSGLFRSTLVWLTDANGFAPWLAMELWRDDPLSAPAVGPTDQIYANHARLTDTPVQLFHLLVDNPLFNHPTLGPVHHEYILRVRNLSFDTVYFGLSVWANFVPAPPTRPNAIPEPAGLSLLATALTLLMHRPARPN